MLDTMALGQPNTVSAFVVKAPKVTLVDCGFASSYETLLAGLQEVGVAPSDVRYVIPTHVHLDHSGAAGRLVRGMPNAEVIAHEKGTPHLVDPTKLMESATRVFGKAIMELYGVPEPIPAGRITSVGKEAHLDLGGGMTATLLHSPGHAPHQLSVMLDGSKMLLTADAVGIVYPGTKTMIPTTPPPSFDPSSLINSVNVLGQTDPNLLLLPHFGARRDVRSILENTRSRVTEWVSEVAVMKKEKKDLDEITGVMVARVASEEGVDDLPIYAKVSIRTSVMGILNYLDKNT